MANSIKEGGSNENQTFGGSFGHWNAFIGWRRQTRPRWAFGEIQKPPRAPHRPIAQKAQTPFSAMARLAAFLGRIFDGYETYALISVVGPALLTLLPASQHARLSAYSGMAIGITLLGWQRVASSAASSQTILDASE